MNRSFLFCRLSLTALIVLFCSQTAWTTQAQELRLVAQLIWSTDGTKPADERLKELDRETQAKLKGVFRWKNYYEVSREEIRLPAECKQRARMSKKCEIEVEHQGRSTIEVKLYGEGKLLLTKRQVLKSGELLVLAGDDKDDTAWFVIITLAKPQS